MQRMTHAYKRHATSQICTLLISTNDMKCTSTSLNGEFQQQRQRHLLVGNRNFVLRFGSARRACLHAPEEKLYLLLKVVFLHRTLKIVHFTALQMSTSHTESQCNGCG